MIKYCPHCKTELIIPTQAGQGIKGCPNCLGIFFILETTKPDDKQMLENIETRKKKLIDRYLR